MNTRFVAMAAMIGLAAAARAAEFHVTTAQELQNALTAAAANGEGDTVYVAAGYYTGNFNFNSAETQSLTVQAEGGVANTEITVDGAGTGRSMNLTATVAADLTVRGLTFTRNCNSTGNAGLRLSTQGGDVLIDNCRAIGVTADYGIGIEIAVAKIVTVRGCIVTLDATSKGDAGISVSGVTGGVTVDNNTVSGNPSLTGSGRGIAVSLGSGVPISISGNNVCSNKASGFGGGIYVKNTSSTIALTNNTVTGNSITTDSGNGIFVSAISGSATLTGNTVRDNIGWGCGGIVINSTSSSTLTGNTVSGNRGNGGSGIYIDGGTVLLVANMLIGNSDAGSGYGGGGVYCGGNGNTTLTGNTIVGNSVANGSGGGVLIGNTASLSGNTVSGNTSARDGGGGIHCTGVATLTGNTVTDNLTTGTYGGGGICCRNSAELIRNNVLGNRSKYSGGGISVQGSTVKLQCNIVGKNTQTQAGYAGGGVWVKATTLLDMINNTVTENAAAGNGGGAAFQVDGTTEILHVYNNILWGNTADGNGDDVHVAGSGSRKEFRYNDAHDLYGVWDITSNNIDAAPLFYDAANRSYYLRSGSPCLNAGFNDAPAFPVADIDNEARIVDTTVDIGADEMSNTDPHPADLNNDWIISEAEYGAYAAAWKNDQTWSRQPNPISADYVTRAGYLKQQSGGAYRNDGGPKPTCWVQQ